MTKSRPASWSFCAGKISVMVSGWGSVAASSTVGPEGLAGGALGVGVTGTGGGVWAAARGDRGVVAGLRSPSPDLPVSTT